MVFSDAELDDDLKDRAKSLVTCSICLEQFDYPKVLPCLHTFCFHCLRRCFESTNSQRLTPMSNFPCPSCRKICYLPAGGLDNLPTDFRTDQVLDFFSKVENSIKRNSKGSIPDICSLCVLQGKECLAKNFCVECNKSFCNQCLKDHSKTKLFQNHTLIDCCLKRSTELTQECEKCSAHGADLDYFCKECSELLCIRCLFSGHEDHTILGREEVVAGIDKELTDIEEHIKKRILKFDEMREELNCYMDRLDVKLKEYESSLEKVDEEVIKLKEKLKRDYLLTGTEKYVNASKILNSRREHLENLQDVFERYYDMLVTARKSNGSQILFTSYKRIKEVDELYTDIEIEPIKYTTCEFVPSPKLCFGTSLMAKETVSFPSLIGSESDRVPKKEEQKIIISEYARLVQHHNTSSAKEPSRSHRLMFSILFLVLAIIVMGIILFTLYDSESQPGFVQQIVLPVTSVIESFNFLGVKWRNCTMPMIRWIPDTPLDIKLMGFFGTFLSAVHIFIVPRLTKLPMLRNTISFLLFVLAILLFVYVVSQIFLGPGFTALNVLFP